ncbi:MAG: hypothetical protein HPY44_20295 [Armatimonadetes bacterium]|nr:hypothetical protein [Armatimonadota bacterium]
MRSNMPTQDSRTRSFSVSVFAAITAWSMSLGLRAMLGAAFAQFSVWAFALVYPLKAPTAA